MGFVKNIFQRKFGLFPKKNPEKVVLELPSEHLGHKVRADIYLPPSYFDPEHQQTYYPVLFFNDGQDMAAVGLKKTLHRLYEKNAIPHLLVVAFHPKDRMQEYGVSDRPDYKNRGSQAKAYADFIIFEFLTFFRSQYRAIIGASENVVAGFSLGGLSAFDLAWQHAPQFGKVGVFSGSLWWRSEAFNTDEPDAHRIAHDMVKEDPIRPKLRFWFQTGTEDEKTDRNKNGVIDSIDDTKDLLKVLQKKGYAKSAMHYLEIEGGKHHPDTWAIALPDFLTWAFGNTKTKQ